jgi:hypothetical protein
MQALTVSRPSAVPRKIAAFLLAVSLSAVSALGQDSFLEYEFDDEDELADFFAPPRAIGCGANLIMGSSIIEDGELLLINGPDGGSVMTLRPDVVDDFFPESRDYRLRMRVNFETHSGIFYIFVRTRMALNFDADAIDITDELGYPVYIDIASQQFGIIEESNCNVAVPHPEWPGNGTWAITDPGFEIENDEWYWLDIIVSGNDDGGPVQITAMTWPDGEDPPDEPQFMLEDTNGLLHTATTVEPDRDVQLLFLNLFGGADQVVRIDELTLSELDPKVTVGPFIRGDCNGDGDAGGVTDAVFLLAYNFTGGTPPPCVAACDNNGDGATSSVTDAVYILNFNFLGGSPLASPFPDCGPGELPTDEGLGCETLPNVCI